MSSGNAETGHRAPQFKAIVVVPDGQFKDISLSDYREKYAVFFFYPLDFTFVYPMEIIAFSDTAEELKKLNCRSFLVVQWLRVCLPKKGTRVRSLVWEDSMCCRETKSICYNYWAHMPQLSKPVHPRACAPQQEKRL